MSARTARRTAVLLLAALGWLGIAGAVFAATRTIQAPVLPPGFVQVIAVSGISRPTDMVLLPNGDMLLGQKGFGSGIGGNAAVRYVRQGVLQAREVITLSANVEGDSGILGITVDPDFANNHFFYLWYAPGAEALGWTGTPTNRLSRFTFDPATGTADRASEQILLDNVGWATMHNGGGLIFDNDGNLLITTGDAASPMGVESNLAQKMDSLNGKILRIRPLPEGGYAIPADNPYVGMTGEDAPRPEIYASGLRNPFRLTKRVSDGAIFVSDVGQVTWEEIDRVLPGANYGWPAREGPCPIHMRTDCPPADPKYTDPILSYLHPEEGGSGITGVAYYDGEDFPAEYRNRLFYADLDRRWVGSADPENVAATHALFGQELDLLTDVEAGAGGLYLVGVWSGRIYYIYYSGDANQPPAVSFAAAPLQGRAPLTVTFSAEGTRDADDLVLQYTWDLGAGRAPFTTRNLTATQVYPTDGVYTATLTVSDLRGGVAAPVQLPIAVFSGEYPEIQQVNVTEPGRTLYQGGDVFRFDVVRSSGVSGLDPATPYLWTVAQHHNDHTHVVLADTAATGITLTLPIAGHAGELDIWYEVELTMVGAKGQRLYFTRELHPALGQVQVDAWPAHPTLPFWLDGLALSYDLHVPVIAGQAYVLEAPATLLYDGQVGEFAYWLATESWPDAGPAAYTPIVIPDRRATVRPAAAAQVYVAHYRFVRAADRLLFPYVAGTASLPPAEPPAEPPVDPSGPPAARVR